jgi:glycosyltransferase involved in cell wall biosynthesis
VAEASRAQGMRARCWRVNRPIRLAIIAAFPVLPTSAGGKIRIVQLARSLCRLGVDVTIIAPYHVTQTRVLAEREPFKLCEVPYPPLLLPFLLVDRPFPYGSLVSFHPGYRALLPVSLDSFDVCQFEHPGFVDLARLIPPSVPIVYNAQNVEFDYVSAESQPGLVRRVAGGRVRALEAQLVERAAHVFACTDADRLRFCELYDVSAGRISVIPNGVDLAAVDAQRVSHQRGMPSEPARFPRHAIFTGSDVKHNREAVRAILTRVAPEFEREIEFVVLGPCARHLRGKRGPNVLIDPDAELAQYARPGAIGLNPIIAGSGSNLKVLYYLAHDLPTLSTPFGMRGYQDLLPWVVTADLDDFPDALPRVLTAPNGVRQQLARYEWNAVAADALQVYEALVADAIRSSR